MKSFVRQLCFSLAFTFALFTSACFAALVPQPMPIGASDDGWVYLGRFIGPDYFSSILEWETNMHRYTGFAEANNLFDVYYYHSHYGTGDGEGCYMVTSNNGAWHYGFSCVIKCVSLDQKARPKHLSGLNHGIFLFSMTGGAKGVFSARVDRFRVFDSVTHQLLSDNRREQNPRLNGNFKDYENSVLQYRNNSPYYIAMHMTKSCPVKPSPFL